MKDCVLVDGVRTPIGRAHAEKGWLRTLRPEDLLGAVYKALFERNQAVKPEDVDVVMVGCANQSGAQNVVSRLSWLATAIRRASPATAWRCSAPLRWRPSRTVRAAS